MNREWNWPIAISLLGASLAGGFNLWFLTEYKPLSPFWELLAIGASVFAIILAPLLVYYGLQKRKRWPAAAAVLTVLAAMTVGLVLFWNGRNDSSPIAYKRGMIVAKEITEAKSGSPNYRFKVRLDEPPHNRVTVATSPESFDRLAVGAPVEIPARAGRLNIPWRIYEAPVNYPRPLKTTLLAK